MLKRSVIIAAAFVALLFVLNLVVSYINTKVKPANQRNEIVDYAHTFTTNPALIPIGRQADCSYFVQTVYRHFGYKLPRSSRSQYSFCSQVTYPKKADLLFFTNKNGMYHVAIMVDSLKFIHSPGVGEMVKTDSLNSTYYASKKVLFASVFKSLN